jgi:hypothetical protein
MLKQQSCIKEHIHGLLLWRSHDQMLKQQSCIKEHVLLLWRSYYQEGKVTLGITLIDLTPPHFAHVFSRTWIFNERCERHVESVEKYSVSCVQITKDGIGS